MGINNFAARFFNMISLNLSSYCSVNVKLVRKRIFFLIFYSKIYYSSQVVQWHMQNKRLKIQALKALIILN